MSLTWRQRCSAILGNAMEYYDIAVFTSISMYISQMFTNQGIANSELIVWGVFAVRFLMRPFGGIVIGRYADKYGRRRALVVCNFLTGLATVAMALVPVSLLGPYVVVVFLLFQMVQAFSFGGEYPTLINYLMFDAQKNQRSRVSSMIVGSTILGIIASLLIVTGLRSIFTEQEMGEWGWRIPLLVGVVNIFVSLYLRLSLPELPKTQRLSTRSSSSSIVKVFGIALLGAVIFYTQNLASGILGKAMNIDNLALINTTILVLFLFIFSFIVDRGFNPHKALKFGTTLLLFAAVPLFLLLESSFFIYQAFAVIAISALIALILGNMCAVLWDQCPNQTTSLSIGYNTALSIFGGLTPLIVSQLMEHGVVYVGVYVALATLPTLFIFAHQSSQEKLDFANSNK